MQKVKMHTVVNGQFHYRHSIPQMYQHREGDYFYSGHPFKQWVSCPGAEGHNFWLKELLIQLHFRYLGGHTGPLRSLIPHINDCFDRKVARHLKAAPYYHLMLHGTLPKTFAKAKELGGHIIGAPLTSHPLTTEKLLSTAADKHRLQWHSGTPPELFMQELALCDSLQLPSHFAAQSYHHHGFSPEKTTVVYPTIDTQWYSPKKTSYQPHKELKALFVGRLSLRKGIFELLEAWQQLALPQATLYLIGPMDQQLKSHLKMPPNVQWLGPKPNRTIVTYYQTSHLLIHPAIEDGFAYTVAEAMACGLPVITTYNTGAGEQITHQESGFLCHALSTPSLKQTIEEAIDLRKEWPTIGHNARTKMTNPKL